MWNHSTFPTVPHKTFYKPNGQETIAKFCFDFQGLTITNSNIKLSFKNLKSFAKHATEVSHPVVSSVTKKTEYQFEYAQNQ